ncbi:protein kinase C delta type-like [Pseudophryne corroboree]|uniref:protein kinase C delta type-like n=1 Tax=Pseudophryne corroboree TaxID=495146 RepID=UPI003081B99D
MDYASGGDLHQFLQRKGCLDITSATFYAAEITCGVQYLHSKGIIHRDLKPENILMAASGHLQITDFGIAIENIFGDQTATEYAGTPGYIAPEMLAEEPYNAGVDWYSFGIIINEMITRTSKYHPRLLLKARAAAEDIVQQLLRNDPSRRLGVNGNICQHPLFQRIDWVSLEALRLTPPPPHIPAPPTITHSSRRFDIERMEAKMDWWEIEIDQELFRGFSYVGSILRASH